MVFIDQILQFLKSGKYKKIIIKNPVFLVNLLTDFNGVVFILERCFFKIFYLKGIHYDRFCRGIIEKTQACYFYIFNIFTTNHIDFYGQY